MQLRFIEPSKEYADIIHFLTTSYNTVAVEISRVLINEK